MSFFINKIDYYKCSSDKILEIIKVLIQKNY